MPKRTRIHIIDNIKNSNPKKKFAKTKTKNYPGKSTTKPNSLKKNWKRLKQKFWIKIFSDKIWGTKGSLRFRRWEKKILWEKETWLFKHFCEKSEKLPERSPPRIFWAIPAVSFLENLKRTFLGFEFQNPSVFLSITKLFRINVTVYDSSRSQN